MKPSLRTVVLNPATIPVRSRDRSQGEAILQQCLRGPSLTAPLSLTEALDSVLRPTLPPWTVPLPAHDLGDTESCLHLISLRICTSTLNTRSFKEHKFLTQTPAEALVPAGWCISHSMPWFMLLPRRNALPTLANSYLSSSSRSLPDFSHLHTAEVEAPPLLCPTVPPEPSMLVPASPPNCA